MVFNNITIFNICSSLAVNRHSHSSGNNNDRAAVMTGGLRGVLVAVCWHRTCCIAQAERVVPARYPVTTDI
jgi:hypothetical protein